MSRIGNKELAQTLVEKYGLDRSAAEQFVSEMFQVLMSGLREDKQVKIKGLGTFKVTSVASRRSVDVNTGDPIIIEGRDKISFVPDASLRDEVNRPFAQFETVVLNDGVDFTDIDRRFDADSDAFVSEVLQTKIATPITIETEEQQNITPPAIPDIEKPEDTLALEAELPKETFTGSEVLAHTVEDNEEVVSSATESESVEEVVEENNTAINTVSEEVSQQVETVLPYEEGFSDETVLSTAVRWQRNVVRALIGVAVVLLIAFVGGIYYFLGELQQRDNRIEHLEAQMVKSKEKQVERPAVTAEPTDSMSEKMKRLEQSVNKAQDDLKRSQADVARKLAEQTKKEQPKSVASEKPVRQETTPVTVQQKPKEEPKYNNDARVRTGAYRIVGIDKTLTVRQGQTLASISRAYLGAGMECYIEAVNGGKKEFKVGDKLNIPKLELKKKRHKKQ